MTDYALNNDAAAPKFRSPLKAREIFLHDGKSLRRIRLSVPLQLSAMAATLSTLCWSVFATAQIASAEPAPAAPVEPVVQAQLVEMQRQVQAMRADVQAIREDVEQRYDMTAEEVRRLGLDPARFHGVGGPLVEADAPSDPNFKALFASWKQLDTLEQGTVSIPSAKPVRSANFTSSFGVRSDPFEGRAAMHAGIDLAGPMGTEIYATADGIVGRSQWAGGYGNLVEINHGKGIQTRYGHLSKSLVRAGERVKRGQLIALMGSTGRSTGSHLHYEVRIDGKAVNPVPYLQSTDYLQSVQARAATTAAIGGPAAGSK